MPIFMRYCTRCTLPPAPLLTLLVSQDEEQVLPTDAGTTLPEATTTLHQPSPDNEDEVDGEEVCRVCRYVGA